MHGPGKYPFSRVSSLRYFVRYLFCTFLRYKTNIEPRQDRTRYSYVYKYRTKCCNRSNRNSCGKRLKRVLKVVRWHIALIRRRQRGLLRVSVGFSPCHFEILYRYSISHNFVLIHEFENNQFDIEIDVSNTFSNNHILVTMYIGSFLFFYNRGVQTKIQ